MRDRIAAFPPSSIIAKQRRKIRRRIDQFRHERFLAPFLRLADRRIHHEDAPGPLAYRMPNNIGNHLSFTHAGSELIYSKRNVLAIRSLHHFPLVWREIKAESPPAVHPTNLLGPFDRRKRLCKPASSLQVAGRFPTVFFQSVYGAML